MSDTLVRLAALIRKELQAIVGDTQSLRLLIMPVILQLLLFPFAATLEVKNNTLAIFDEDGGPTADEIIQRLTQTPGVRPRRPPRERGADRLDDRPSGRARGASIPSEALRDRARPVVPPPSRRCSTAGAPTRRRSRQLTSSKSWTAYPWRRSSGAARRIDGSQLVQPQPQYSPVCRPLVGRNDHDAERVDRHRPVGRARGRAGNARPATGKPPHAVADLPRQGGARARGRRDPGHDHPRRRRFRLRDRVSRFASASLWVHGRVRRSAGRRGSAHLERLRDAAAGVLGGVSVHHARHPSFGYVTPIDNMPAWLQAATWANPVRHFIEIAKGVYLKDEILSDFSLNVIALLVIGVVTSGAALAVFHRRLS